MDDDEDLIARLNSRDPEIAGRAALDAADAGLADAAPTLLKLLEAGDPATLGPVAAALGELKAEAAKPRLLELLKDPGTRGWRGSLIYGLMLLDCRNNFPDALDLTFDDSFEVRTKALMILEEIVASQSDDALTAGRSQLRAGPEAAAAMNIIDDEIRKRRKGRRARSDS